MGTSNHEYPWEPLGLKMGVIKLKGGVDFGTTNGL